jgi:hypothetical protein
VYLYVQAFRLQGLLRRIPVPVSEYADSDRESASMELFLYHSVLAWSSSMPSLTLYPITDSTELDLQERTDESDLNFAFIGYCILGCYVFIVLYRRKNRVKSQGLLSFAAMTSVFMAVGSSFGLLALCGVEYNTAVGSLLLILMGVGVDDAFIILDSVNDSPLPVKEVVRRVGTSVGRWGTTGIVSTVTVRPSHSRPSSCALGVVEYGHGVSESALTCQ